MPVHIVISQSQSKNPEKRKLEERILDGVTGCDDFRVVVVPHLYDIPATSDCMNALKAITGDLIVCSWNYERPTRWVLDRNGIGGRPGEVFLTTADDDDDDDEEADPDSDPVERVIDSRDVPQRRIFCLDLKASSKPKDFVNEILRIRDELIANAAPGHQPSEANGAADSVSAPAHGPDSYLTLADILNGGTGGDRSTSDGPQPDDVMDANAVLAGQAGENISRFVEKNSRRWYPVIDYSRCTNCMECIDFCLFGVYGVDRIDTILVEQPDNCRKGCPACSRVCPENAIMFPQHKTPAIAGSNESAASLKIDLSQLFGAPTDSRSAIEVAAAERDEQLELVGRETVGLSVGIPKRQTDSNVPRDELDDLLDELDELDL